MNFAGIYSIMYFFLFIGMIVSSVIGSFIDYHEYQLLKQKKKNKIKNVYFYDVLHKQYIGFDSGGTIYTRRLKEATLFTQKYNDKGEKYFVNIGLPNTKLFIIKDMGELSIQEFDGQPKRIGREGFFIKRKEVKHGVSLGSALNIPRNEIDNNRQQDTTHRYTYPNKNKERGFPLNTERHYSGFAENLTRY